MNLLLDTHLLLWWLDANPRISEKAKSTIADENDLTETIQADITQSQF